MTRVKTHLKQLKDLPSGLKTFARHFATGKYEEIELGSTNRDAFGLRKFILVGTEQGSLFALDSANKGNIVWRLKLGGDILGTWILRESSAVRGQPPVVGILVSSGSGAEFVLVNGLDGVEYEREPVNLEVSNIGKAFQLPSGLVDGLGRRPVVVIPKKGIAKILPASADARTLLAQLGDKLYYSLREENAVQGYFFDIDVLSLFLRSLHPVSLRYPNMAFPNPSGDTTSLPLVPPTRRKSRIHRPRPRRSFRLLQIPQPTSHCPCRRRPLALPIHALSRR